MTAYVTAADQYTNKLTKVYRHEGKLADKVVCYFANNPIWNQIPHAPRDSAESQRVTITYFLPKVAVASREAQKMINGLHNARSSEYQIAIQSVTRPMEGIEIAITYDPDKISFACEQFDAISQQKGLVFSFHHKDVLNQIHRKTDTIMNYAHNKHHKPKVMLDCGHGGHDAGKVGHGGIKEKDITLQVGKKVASLLHQQGYQVILTRKTDVFVPLDVRTSLTNTQQADIFVSIHANGAVNEKAEGIETFWMNPGLLKPHDAAAEITHFTKHNYGAHKLLASHVHKQVIKQARATYPAKDRTVKEAVSQVLLGTDYSIPSALIEIGFLSHEREATLLAQSSYQDTIARGICDGITSYFKALSAA